MIFDRIQRFLLITKVVQFSYCFVFHLLLIGLDYPNQIFFLLTDKIKLYFYIKQSQRCCQNNKHRVPLSIVIIKGYNLKYLLCFDKCPIRSFKIFVYSFNIKNS